MTDIYSVAGGRAPEVKPPAFVSERLAKALSHPLRVRILVELNKRVMSPAQFQRQHAESESLSTVARHFRILEEHGCMEVVEEKTGGRRRGATEHFYRAIQRSLFDESRWAALPPSMKAEITGATFDTYLQRVVQSFEAGTIDSRDDRHLTWSALNYDEIAWQEIVEKMDELFQRSLELQVESALRMRESGGEGIPVTVALAAFESPRSPAPAD